MLTFPSASAERKGFECRRLMSASGQATRRKCIDGRENRLFSNRKVNDGYILEEYGKALAKRGKHFAEKWCL